MFTDTEIEEIDEYSVDMIQWIVETRGRGVPFLDDEQQRQVAEILDSEPDAEKRYQRVLDVIEDTCDQIAVENWMKDRR